MFCHQQVYKFVFDSLFVFTEDAAQLKVLGRTHHAAVAASQDNPAHRCSIDGG